MTQDYEKYLEELLLEQRISAENMTNDERNYYFVLLANCKDLIDTKYKVGSCSKGEIVELKFVKEDNNSIKFNGSVTYYDAANIRENRCIFGTIELGNNRVLVETEVERIKCQDKDKSYTVFDTFSFINGKVDRKSKYSNELAKDYNAKTNIEWKAMK